MVVIVANAKITIVLNAVTRFMALSSWDYLN